MRRRFVLRAGALITALYAVTEAVPAELAACRPGSLACPAALHMKRGAVSVTTTGRVSREEPVYYVEFSAREGQVLTLHAEGGGLKLSGGIPIQAPGGRDDAVEADTGYSLPASGRYVLALHANLMSEGPFGRFTLTVTIR